MSTTLAKTGLKTNVIGEKTWHTDLASGLAELEARTGLVYTGDPNGHVVGSWLGQTCFDTTNGVLYFCSKVGSVSVAEWVSPNEDPTPPGVFTLFMRLDLPSGWLPCDGVVRAATAYPRLFAVLPANLKTGTISFTLPNINERLALLIGGAGNIGTFVGSNNTGDGGGINAVDVNATVPDNPLDTTEHGYVADGYVQVSSGGGPTVMTFPNRILAQKVRVPAAPAHFHATAPRGLLLVAGVRY